MNFNGSGCRFPIYTKPHFMYMRTLLASCWFYPYTSSIKWKVKHLNHVTLACYLLAAQNHQKISCRMQGTIWARQVFGRGGLVSFVVSSSNSGPSLSLNKPWDLEQRIHTPNPC